MHAYRVFGLTIHSELELPGLDAGEGPSDVQVRFGEVPYSLPNPEARGVLFEATGSELILKVNGHARYWAANGREVIVAPEQRADPDTVRLFLLSPVLGAILHQRGVLPLHASAVEMHGTAVIFLGPSGVGKSSIAAALAMRGYPILTDEIGAVVVREGRPLLLPGAPYVGIWADTMNKLDNTFGLGALLRVRPELEKYRFPSRFRCREGSVPIAKAYVLSTTNTAGTKVVRLRGIRTLTALMGQTFRPQFMGEDSRRGRHFDICAAVAKKADVFELTRSEPSTTLSEIVEIVDGLRSG